MINFDELLQPINTSAPCGTDLRANHADDSLYHQLRENRNQARIAERKQESTEEAGQYTHTNEYWHFILEQTPLLLQQQSKDLEISCWLLEAQVRYRGFVGLADALAFINQLFIQYWPNLYPNTEGEDIEDRLACLQGLNGYSTDGALIAPIYMLSIVPETAAEKISTWDYLQTKQIKDSSHSTPKKEPSKASVRSMIELQKNIKNSDAPFYQALLVTIATVKQNLAALSHTLIDLFKKQAPSLKNIEDAVNHVQNAVTSLTNDILRSTDDKITESTAILEKEESTTAAKFSGEITSYQQAMQQLEQLAQFMQQSQPLSLMTTQLARLVRWSQLPVEAVIAELFMDKSLGAHVAHEFGVNEQQFMAAVHGDAAAGNDGSDYDRDNDLR